MGAFDNLLLTLDEGITDFFAQWNIYSTIIVTAFIGFVTYQLSTRKDPDTHPMLLVRQSQGSAVRQPGQSPVYRGQSAPHSMPLQTGLNVKDPGASRWARGRDGDLRDIWRQAVAGVQEDGPNKGAKGKILSVFGTEHVTEHSLDDITRQINLIGQHIKEQGGSRVAIYIPNSVELLAALFSCAFYNLTAVVLPFEQPEEEVISMLRRSGADTVITAPGCFPFDLVAKHYPSLRQLIWIVEEGSRHMDWNEVPEGTGSSVNVSTWHEIIGDSPAAAGRELPALEGQKEPTDVILFWQFKSGVPSEMVTFTASNFASAIAAQLFAIPTSQKMGPSDLFLPADSLANSHTLVLTLAALFSNASVALNSVGTQAYDLAVATRGISPTILVATPAALIKTHQETSSKFSSLIARNLHWLQTRHLTQYGVMPTASFLSSYYDSLRPSIGTKPGKLRLILTAERVGSDTPRLSSQVLSDLRAYTGARIIYALTAAKVAGAVTQTLFYDYRVFEDKCSHFGPPLSSTEVFFKDMGEYKTTDGVSRGEIVVKGPSVSGGETALGVAGYMRDDNTLAYA
ncbi:hypothetical protein QBC32DRAFT_339914 [Pseudoneurospora amorphoporcata]|uniref:AMP-dependent synthetase/ligase domain-containing protein n=1 Tax=Pseudoneurospora amorphoporcata TaxID=241081 RepID=A0AAN6SHC4_9PEZI|nr:hypothetical protein QBC32DRAFT_339914 [Pseudoneurospora amorphoporcata]